MKWDYNSQDSIYRGYSMKRMDKNEERNDKVIMQCDTEA